MTAGLLFKASHLGLDSNVLNSQERKERIVLDTRELARLKALEEYTMQKAVALKILSLNNPITDLSVKELKALVHYKKIKYNGAVPNAKKDLLERYEAIYFRADQTRKQMASCLSKRSFLALGTAPSSFLFL